MIQYFFEFIRSVFFFVGAVKQKNGFPLPLSRKEEEALVERHERGDKQARDLLIEHNLRLVAHIAKKYASPSRSIDDLISIGTVGLIKAIDSYNSEKCPSVAGYSSRCIENEILMFIRSERKHSGEISLDEPIGADRDGNEITLSDVLADGADPIIDSVIESSSGRSARKAVNSLLTEQERRVIRLRYGLDDGLPLPQREVGKLLGISRSYVSRIEKRALIKLNAALSGRL